LQDWYALRSSGLTDEQRRLISDADTFFIASAQPEGGADASHRGGNPSFVRFLGKNALEFLDYSGNTLVDTSGNIAENPSAGLLLLGFEGGGTLQLMAEARLVWDARRAARFTGAERVIEFPGHGSRRDPRRRPADLAVRGLFTVRPRVEHRKGVGVGRVLKSFRAPPGAAAPVFQGAARF
jgi:hypothetical protein